MSKLFYCNNCLNKGLIIKKSEPTLNGLLFVYKEVVINGFIDFPSNIIDHSKCPHCNGSTVEMSLTVEEWNVLKNISTDSSFILEMDKLKQSDIVDFNLKLSQFKANASLQQQPTFSPQPQSSIPKCPTCGSTNIKKISGTKRWVGTGLFGLASSDLGKNMQCNSCGAKW